jgi:GR25 family glycosyltransferase involved in LPS biosynthesis
MKDEFRGYALEESLKVLGYNPLRIDSIDLRGSNIFDLGLDEDLVRQWNNRSLTSGELGCLRSHQKAWLKFLETKNEWSIFLEDDANLDSHFSDFFESVNKLKSRKPTIVSAFWPTAISHKKVTFLHPKVPNTQFLKVTVPPYSTVCYALNRKAAEMHFELPNLEITTADWPISSYLFDFYVYKRKAVSHSEGVSTISETRKVAQSDGTKASQSYMPSLTERIFTFLGNTWSIARALKVVGYPNVRRIIFKRSLYNLYYLRLIHLVPRVAIHSGQMESLQQIRVPLFYLLKLILPLCKHTLKFIYWRLIRANKVRFRSFLARFFIYFWRRTRISTDYIDFLSRDKNLVKLLNSSQEGKKSISQEAKRISFTCVLNVYNESNIQLRNAFFSIINQKMNFDEIVVYNDGSTKSETKDALEYLRKAAKEVVHTRIIFADESNRGVIAARNNAAKLVKSDWIIFLDADDELLPSYLESVHECVLAFPTAEIVYPDYYVSKKGQVPVRSKSGPSDIRRISKVNTIPHSSFIKLDLFSALGGYSPIASEIGAEDWELWVRASLHSARFVHLNLPGYVYNAGNVNSRSDQTDHFIKERNLMVQKTIEGFKFRTKSYIERRR